MTAKHIGIWSIIETLGTVPTFIASNMQVRSWKPIHNEFRGKELELVKALIFTVIEQLKTTQSLFTGFTYSKIFYAIPVLGPHRQVHGINLWLGSPDAEISAPPEAIAWNILLDQGEPYIEFLHGRKPLTKILEKFAGTLSEVIKVYDIFDSLQSDSPSSERAAGEIHLYTAKEEVNTIRYIVQSNRTAEGRYIQGLSYYLQNDQFRSISVENRLLDWFMAKENCIPALRQISTGKIRLWLHPQSRMNKSAILHGQEVATEIIIEYAGIDTELIVVIPRIN